MAQGSLPQLAHSVRVTGTWPGGSRPWGEVLSPHTPCCARRKWVCCAACSVPGSELQKMSPCSAWRSWFRKRVLVKDPALVSRDPPWPPLSLELLSAGGPLPAPGTAGCLRQGHGQEEPHKEASPGLGSGSTPLGVAQNPPPTPRPPPLQGSSQPASIVSEEPRTHFGPAPEGSALAFSPPRTTWPQIWPPHRSPLPALLQRPRAYSG